MRKLITLLTIIISIGFLTYESSVFADNYEWRCGNLFVGKGVHSFKVLEQCGEPTFKEELGQSGTQNSGNKKEKWVYGPYADYYYVVYIKSGIVEEVISIKR